MDQQDLPQYNFSALAELLEEARSDPQFKRILTDELLAETLQKQEQFHAPAHTERLEELRRQMEAELAEADRLGQNRLFVIVKYKQMGLNTPAPLASFKELGEIDASPAIRRAWEKLQQMQETNEQETLYAQYQREVRGTPGNRAWVIQQMQEKYRKLGLKV